MTVLQTPKAFVKINNQPQWGSTGKVVFDRTYSRPKPDGSREEWGETVSRVVRGNIGLLHGTDESRWAKEVKSEAQELWQNIYDFKIIPAGRHLWASGVQGRQYLFNCHVSGWGEKLSDHFDFTFMRLMEGGGVGANYSTKFLTRYGAPKRQLKVHIVSDQDHKDYDKFSDIVSDEFSSEWAGSFQIQDSREGWAAAIVDLIDTFYADKVEHSDRVYDISIVRPYGSPLKRFGGTASGPSPLARLLLLVADTLNSVHASGGNVRPLDAMAIDHGIADCVVAGGVRRSARMAIVRWDDPDIFEFINCKEFGGHWTTNISIEVDDVFNEALAGNNEFTEHARKVHTAAVRGMLINGEPGYWNSTYSNVGEVNRVDATNPCGEIALQQWENCNLGHVNLEAFAPQVKGDSVDEEALHRAHELVTRFLIRATYGDVTDPKQAEILAKNRRIGVGHLGVQGYLVLNGIRYSDAPKHESFRKLLRSLYQTVRAEARDYSFQLRIPEPVKVTTVAPTGSIAKLPGVTEGIHPIFARYFYRRVRFSKSDPDQAYKIVEFRSAGFHVEDDVVAQNTAVVTFPTLERLVAKVADLGYPDEIVESANEIDFHDMLAFQAMYQQEYADNAVSYTVNLEQGRYTQDEAEKIIAKWLPRLKGTTIMTEGSYAQAPYERLTKEQFEAIDIPVLVEDGTDEDCASGACPIR